MQRLLHASVASQKNCYEPAQNDAIESEFVRPTSPPAHRPGRGVTPFHHYTTALLTGTSKMRVLPALVAASAATSALAFQPAATERPTTALSASAAAGIDRRSVLLKTAASAISTAALLSVATTPEPASARLEAVNRPDLLPTESGKNVIQVSMVGSDR